MKKNRHILLVDDHPVVRNGFQRILAEKWPDATFRETGDGQQAVDIAIQESWNIIIMDINLPGRNGIDAVKSIKYSKPNAPILILTIHPEEHYGVRAIKAGAAGFLTKDCTVQEFLNAVETVMDGRMYLSARLGESLATQSTARHASPFPQALSDREMEIVCLLAAGNGILQIANRLNLSPKTVSSYRARVLEKLNLETTADIIRWAIENHVA